MTDQSPSPIAEPIERAVHPEKEIVVIYHDQCRDGFGAAYAAWKKFGESAWYVPLKAGTDAPTGLTDKELYIVDFSFSYETLAQLREQNRSVVVIDHHISAQAAVTAWPENIFDLEHSGAVLAWRYFHPDTPTPPLLEYVEDHDIWKFALPNNREINAALGLEPATFAAWDSLITRLTDPGELASFIERGATIAAFEDHLVSQLLEYKEWVEFAGHRCYAINIARPYRSIVGHHLAKLSAAAGGAPLGIVYYRNQGGVNISLRSEGDLDVAKLAEQYGGGGHVHAASIRVASFADLPFTFQ
jgi:oligoribonuclease NrnB/cAMP/cGMP phosphodiesterase (DHH superfamily)